MDTAAEDGPSGVGTSKDEPKPKKGRVRKRKVEAVAVAEDPSLDPDQQSSDTIYSCITFEEKKRLLNAIKTKGFGIIYTPELLSDEFPGRSVNEISFMIKNYKRKGKEFANKMKMSANIDVNEKTGTEQWYSLIHNLVPHLSKRDDLSDDLMVELFNQFSEEESKIVRPGTQANYDQIYGYLADIMVGKYPRDLNAFDSLVVLSIIEKLHQYSVNFDCKEEEEFVEGGSWCNKPDDKSDENQEEISDDISAGSSGSKLIETYFKKCLDYPKIRKLKQCFNPMNVPVKILQNEHEKVSRLLESFQSTQ